MPLETALDLLNLADEQFAQYVTRTKGTSTRTRTPGRVPIRVLPGDREVRPAREARRRGLRDSVRDHVDSVGLNEQMVWPFTRAGVKLAVPKFVSGSTPPEPDGASAIASADASRAFFSVCVVTKSPPVVPLWMCSVKWPEPSVVTEPFIESPGRTAMLRLTGNFGYISYHA